MEIQVFCAENYTKVVTSFQNSFNNSWFRQKPVLKPVLHMYLGVRSPLMEKSHFAQNWTYTHFELSGQNMSILPCMVVEKSLTKNFIKVWKERKLDKYRDK